LISNANYDDSRFAWFRQQSAPISPIFAVYEVHRPSGNDRKIPSAPNTINPSQLRKERWIGYSSSRLSFSTRCAIFAFFLAVAPGVASEDASTEARSPADAMRGATRTADNGAGPRAQDLSKNVSGIFVNAPASNIVYSPSFVMRGFPSDLPLFDGAAHGVTAQVADLSAIDHVEFYRGPSAALLGISP
jgi:hypothetical protein